MNLEQKCLPIISIVILCVFSCSKCDEPEIAINQIGQWEGMRITYRVSNDIDTISIDTTDLILNINEDFTGMYNEKNILNWKKEFNQIVERDNIRLEFDDGTLNSSFIHIDEVDYQEWENHELFSGTFEKRSIYHKLNRR